MCSRHSRRYARRARLPIRASIGPSIGWWLSRTRSAGWSNRYSYARKMVVDIDHQGQPSKWVTLRACRVLKAVAGEHLDRLV